MSSCLVTLTANAGVALCMGQTRVWVDALHTHKVPGFSTVTPALWEAMAARPEFADPSLLIYTHRHPDHFSRRLTQEVLNRAPGAKVILPEQVFPGQLLLTKDREQLELGGLTVYFARLPHEGAQYADVPHYGCIIEQGGFRCLIPGDCALEAPELAAFAAEHGPLDLALLDFPWAALPKGRRFVEQFLRPRSLLIYHLPFAADDVNGYRRAAMRAAPQLSVPDVRLLLEPFQQEAFF